MPDPLKPNAEEIQKPVAPATTEPVEPAQQQVEQPTPPQQPGESESRYQQRINQLTAARRAAEERARNAEEELIRIRQQQAYAQRPQADPRHAEQKMVGQMSKEEWVNWHDEDPLAANEYLADLRADHKAAQIISGMQTQNQYVNSIEEVYKNHPELREVMEGKKNPEEAPFWQVYDEVAREMPDARNLAKGPILVMKEAERRMKERDAAVKERQIADNAATAENERQNRVGASHTLGASGRPPVSSVKLSAEEEKIARKFGQSPEEYAKYKKVAK